MGRPDILFAVNKLAQYTTCPNETLFKSAKRILRYLKGTNNLVLRFTKSNSTEINTYTDSDWAGDKTTRHSTSGSITMISGTPTNWFSRKQKSLSQNTFEAEFFGANESTKSIMWTSYILDELEVKTNIPPLLCDSQSAISLAKNRIINSRSKHIGLREKLVRKCVKDGTIDLKYIPSNENIADIMTKPLSKERHNYLTRKMLQPLNLLSLVFFTFMLLIASGESLAPFIRESPVLWLTSEREALSKTILIKFVIRTYSPCNIYDSANATLDTAIGNSTDVVETMFKNTCEELYTQKFTKKLPDLIEAFNFNRRHKEKRDVKLRKQRGLKLWATKAAITLAPILLAPAATISSVFLISAFAFGAYTVSRITTINEEIEDLKTQSDFYHRFSQAVANDMELLRVSIISKQQTMAAGFRLTILHDEMNNRFNLMARDLEDATHELREEKLAKGLIRAFKLKVPVNGRYPERYMSTINFEEVIDHHKTKNYIYTIKASEVDSNCVVKMAKPFRMVERNKTHQCIFEYAGEREILFNRSISNGCNLFTYSQEEGNMCYSLHSRCIAKVEPWISSSCTNLNNSRLDQVQIFYHLHENLIYCKYNNIVIDNRIYECPDYVFSLRSIRWIKLCFVEEKSETCFSRQESIRICQRFKTSSS